MNAKPLVVTLLFCSGCLVCFQPAGSLGDQFHHLDEKPIPATNDTDMCIAIMSSAEGSHYSFRIYNKELAQAPVWTAPLSVDPPLSVSRAVEICWKELPHYVMHPARYDLIGIGLLRDSTTDRWFYKVTFEPKVVSLSPGQIYPSVTICVLMNGYAVKGSRSADDRQLTPSGDQPDSEEPAKDVKPGGIGVCFSVENAQYINSVDGAEMEETPKWKSPRTMEPPLKVSRAVEIASKDLGQYVVNTQKYLLTTVELIRSGHTDWWVYEVGFEPSNRHYAPEIMTGNGSTIVQQAQILVSMAGRAAKACRAVVAH